MQADPVIVLVEFPFNNRAFSAGLHGFSEQPLKRGFTDR